MSKIILASKSVARQTVLKSAGIDCDISPANIDEGSVKTEIINSGADNPAEKIALKLAQDKAVFVSNEKPDAYVIGGDQTLSLNGKLYSKPKDLDGVKNHLTDFSGRVHTLHSGLAVARGGKIIFDGVYEANMSVKKLSDEYINWYVENAGADVMGSVGAYHYEGFGVQLFDKVDGDYFTILGLPVIPLIEFLQSEGLIQC